MCCSRRGESILNTIVHIVMCSTFVKGANCLSLSLSLSRSWNRHSKKRSFRLPKPFRFSLHAKKKAASSFPKKNKPSTLMTKCAHFVLSAHKSITRKIYQSQSRELKKQ